jgi:hypothetical protein
MKVIDYCKGCVTFELDGYCDMKEFNLGETIGPLGDESGKCPCNNCLVKSMCDTACTEYRDWQFKESNENKRSYDG